MYDSEVLQGRPDARKLSCLSQTFYPLTRPTRGTSTIFRCMLVLSSGTGLVLLSEPTPNPTLFPSVSAMKFQSSSNKLTKTIPEKRIPDI